MTEGKLWISNFKDFLPTCTKLKILSLKGDEDKFDALLRLGCDSVDSFKAWLRQHESLSKITYRMRNTTPSKGKTVIFKAEYRCQHNTYPKLKYTELRKHTDCQAFLSVTIKSSVKGRRVRSNDELRWNYPTVVKIHHHHNHSLNTPEVLKFRDVSEDVKKKFVHLLKCNYSPTVALEIHKQDLLKQYKERYDEIATDRSLLPDIGWVYRFKKSCIPKPKPKIIYSNDKSSLQPVPLVSPISCTELSTSILTTNEETHLHCSQNLINEQNYKTALNAFFRKLEDGLRKYPSSYLRAIGNFALNVEKLSTDTMFLSALNSFGKNIEEKAPSVEDTNEILLHNPQTENEKSLQYYLIQPQTDSLGYSVIVQV